MNSSTNLFSLTFGALLVIIGIHCERSSTVAKIPAVLDYASRTTEMMRSLTTDLGMGYSSAMPKVNSLRTMAILPQSTITLGAANVFK